MTALGFTPWGNRLVIEPHAKVEKIGSLVVPIKAQERPRSGTLIAVGTDAQRWVSYLDRIVTYADGAGIVAEVDGRQVLLMDPADVLTIQDETAVAPEAVA